MEGLAESVARTRRVRRHGSSLIQSDPTPQDPVNDPQACTYCENIRKDYSNNSGEENSCNDQPEERIPECANLPAKMGIKVRAAHIVSLDVIEDDRDDRRPTGKKGRDDKRGPKNTHQYAKSV